MAKMSAPRCTSSTSSLADMAEQHAVFRECGGCDAFREIGAFGFGVVFGHIAPHRLGIHTSLG